TSGHLPARIRSRLIVWMLVAVGVAILLLGVPLAVIARQWIYSQELAALRSDAQTVERALDDPQAVEQLGAWVAVVAVTLDVRLSVLDPGGRVLRDSAGVAPGTVFDDPVVDPVRRGVDGRSGARLRNGAMVAAVAGEIDGTPVIIRLARSGEAAAARVGTALLAISALGAAALVAGAAMASWRARQLAVPLEALALSARRLGQGDLYEHAPRSGTLEIDHIAGALDATAARLRTALQRSASFTGDASHQLRTPLTALRLVLEALEAELGTSHPMLDAAQAEIDRLEATITELLELADVGVASDRVDLRALVLERLDAWRTLADAAGRAVRVTREPVPPVRVRPGAVGQALQVLLDNALVHGRGDVTVWLESVSRSGRSWVRLCVGDEGPGVAPAHLDGGGGRGLSLARSLVEAEGGRVVIDEMHGGRVCLLLPCDGAADDAPVETSPTRRAEER
ncbi:MAG TPA: HAMP domain-containing sensor histidine kinase, partial [Euzebyales bacterium]|nr:HAMP domain-containing sensor histidine kinase [Euzebyales bacterium]